MYRKKRECSIKCGTVYAPEEWNDNGKIQESNNCYTYALNDPDNPKNHVRGSNPGEVSGLKLSSVDINEVANAAISDGLKKPNLFNKLGFGKRGYYEVYLVVDIEGGDYHWYRQDKGGNWSQKHGLLPVDNVDGSNHLIYNPERANQNYFNGVVNYNNGGIFLWVKRR